MVNIANTSLNLCDNVCPYNSIVEGERLSVDN